MHTHLTHGQKWARNPLGRKGENSRDFATFISGTAVCRDVPAEVYGTLSQRLAITGLLVFKGLLRQNMKSPVSLLPTTDIYQKDKINSSACVCVHMCMCIHHPCKLLLTKGKLDRKQNIKTDKGRKKQTDLSHPRLSQLRVPAGHRGKEARIQSAEWCAKPSRHWFIWASPKLNKPISFWNLASEGTRPRSMNQDTTYYFKCIYMQYWLLCWLPKGQLTNSGEFFTPCQFLIQ